MAKTYKSFVKEYAMGLQVPATSFMKPMASMKLKKKEDYDRDDEVQGKKVFKPAKHMPKDSGGKLDLDEPLMKGSPLKTVKKVHNTTKARHSIMGMPSTKYKGLAPGFVQDVPNYVDG